MTRSERDLPEAESSGAVDLDFPDDPSASAAERAVDAELSRVLSTQLRGLDVPPSCIDVAAIARASTARRPLVRRRRVRTVAVLAAVAAVAVVAVMLGRGLFPQQQRPADAQPAGVPQSEVVAPWGDSRTQFLTAEPLTGEGFFIVRPPSPVTGVAAPQMAARVSGTLTLLEGGCLGIAPGTTVVWPAGTVALPDAAGVRLADGQVQRVGEVIESGGGYTNIQFQGRASACPGQDVATLNDVTPQ